MPDKKPSKKPKAAPQEAGSGQSNNSEEYRLMLELDALETLREEMEERGLNSLSDIIEQIRTMNERLDRLEQQGDTQVPS